MIVVHVTHEATEKIGGIGAVIAGLMTSKAYQEKVSRTILVGPLFSTDQPVNRRLGEGGKVIYSSLDEVFSEPWREKFSAIERTYDAGLIYGTREVHDPCSGDTVEAEVLLADVFHSNQTRLNLFKSELYKKFAIPSKEFEHMWEYEQYVRLAEPAFEALEAIGADGNGEPVLLLSHEYMGMPTALRAVLSGNNKIRTVFYAHEVASVRPIVEDVPGHDTMFYNVLEAAEKEGKFIEDVFPSVHKNFKHPLVKAARYCDHVFAVGDYVIRELRFLDRHFRTMDIDLVYNGIPASPLKLQEKKASMGRMKTYCENLLGYRPDWVFSHVARPVRSKGIWRDLAVLHELEPMFKKKGQKAVFFMLGTLGGQRRRADILQMERVYDWPVQHEEGYPDLCGGEEELGRMFAHFNKDHEAVRTILVNQWDWNAHVCGRRMPEDMSFADIRCGIDLEFGLSVYEPFGISQFEGLSFGALCVVSNVCGCLGFAHQAIEDGGPGDTIIDADYLGIDPSIGLEALLTLPMSKRDAVENAEAKRLAKKIFANLANDDKTLAKRIDASYDLAQRMSWDHVVNDYFVPALDRAARES